jgi:secreted trypsin-like serine protease
VKKDDSYTVNGIVSAGSPDCKEGQYVIFTNVPKFVDWIKQEMAKDDEDEEQGDGATLVCKFQESRESK